MKRFVLEELVSCDRKTGCEDWRTTKLSSDNPIALASFLSKRYRIFDTVERWVYKIKYDENGFPII
ncbi:hypothetical protein [Paenibacillus odorifer]|uniref:hypothetical protein n=1 Tax=Paenibacillus odorifer TaxID=189426 RepID=UPI00096CCCAF|nr:hypothetical protein [Paenibacillus odorifer]OMD66772.1 hypothetical protein BSK50_30615 [Paenibacillus odorifer]